MLDTKLFVRCAVFIVDKVQSTCWEQKASVYVEE